MARIDFEEQKEKIKTSLIYWKAKFLSLKGRIIFLNIFILSKLLYLCECSDIPSDIQTDIRKMITTFMWNDKKHHQRCYESMIKEYQDGGLKLMDIEYKIKTYRIRWIIELIKLQNLDFERFLVDKLIGKQSQMSEGLNIIKYDKKIIYSKIKILFIKMQSKFG